MEGPFTRIKLKFFSQVYIANLHYDWILMLESFDDETLNNFGEKSIYNESKKQRNGLIFFMNCYLG